MRHRVIVNQVLAQAFEEAVGIAVGEAYSIVDTRIIDQPVDTTILLLNVFNGALALLRISQLRFKEVASRLVLHLAKKVFDVIGSPAYNDYLRAFFDARTRNRFADTGATTSHDNDTSFKSKIHNHSVKLLTAG